MNLLKRYSLSLLIAFAFTPVSLYASPDKTNEDDFAVARVLNIGQGSFNVVSFKDKDKHNQHIIIDCGSKGFKNTAHNIINNTNTSYALNIDQHLKRYKNDLSVYARQDDSKLNIFAVIFSHPDTDHVNKILKFLGQDTYVKHIICPGEGYKYNSVGIESNSLQNWLLTQLNHEASIYFTAYGKEPAGEQDIKTFLEKKDKDVVETSCTPYSYVDDRGDMDVNDKLTEKEFKDIPFRKLTQDLYKLNKTVRLSFLAVNPTHTTDEKSNKATRPATNPNDDSLVIKVRYGQSSILFQGDATGKVTHRIQANYKDSDKQHYGMHVTVNVVAHHGASTKGSNNPQVIEAIGAQTDLVSAATNHEHPTSQASDHLIKDSALQTTVQYHSITINGGKDKLDINKDFYSTFDHGSFTMKLYKSKEIDSVESLSAEFPKESPLKKTNNSNYILNSKNQQFLADPNTNTNNNNNNNVNTFSNDDSSSSSSSDEDDDTNTNTSHNSHKADNSSASRSNSSPTQTSATKRKRSPQKSDNTQNNSNSFSTVSQTQDSSNNDSPDNKKARMNTSRNLMSIEDEAQQEDKEDENQSISFNTNTKQDAEKDYDPHQ